MVLNRDLREFIKLLNANKVRYLIVGGYAVAYHGHPHPNQIVQLGNPPNRIELFFSLKGVDFESCYASRVAVKVDHVTANFIDLENLKKNKKATGRLQDLADLENLE